MTGEYALINFYSKLVGVSPEIALQSFGILETVLITIILFWFTSKITKSKTIAPILTAIFFVISPLLLPRSIDIITQHKPIFLALSLALPMMIFTVLPKNLSKYYRKYLIYSIIIFTAIALIDLFTFVILLSPFLVLAFFFYQKKYRQFYYLVVLAYFVSLVFVMSIYGFTGLHYNLGFNSIITSNLLSLNVFTHLPDLILPYDELINIYQYISLFNVVLILFLIKHKKHWLNSFLFILYFNALIFINTLNISWIDEDLLRLSLTIFIPVVIGISIALLFKVIFSFSEKVITNLRIKYNYGVLAIFSIAAVVFYLYKPAIYDTERKDNTDHHAMLVLEAYEKISQDYLPFSYTIVNDYRSYVLSINKHFYMPYSTFKDFYLRRDSIYHTNINDKLFFKQNPESILSKSILVFVHKANNNKTPNLPFYHDNEMEYVAETINILKSRGRKVNIIYENESLSVMEIVNKPNSSKINDLLF
ncbi:hypothetical protein JBL43_07545 [Aureibaculum sp. A20]|uniref:Glycosyltransferase RgtA/B/C/D-like domain-containing protein n=1 Tax=Aureibaculum flavum TaxID=2795986 RepID=A0ABS0WQ31_9FLAO|nr:hypothetical protein [Aureibaculum flavum]MBJ2174085.1 hypothetical protein [Aureibaculum flavum]